MNKMLKRRFINIIMIPVLLAVIMMDVRGVKADTLPYDCYNYDYWENIVFTPAAYVADGSITGVDLGINDFSSPQDFCVADNGKVYIADTGNNRIIVTDTRFQSVEKIIDSFDNNGVKDTFNKPYSVTVSEKNQLYIADSDNGRVVVLDADGNLVRFVQDPKSEILEDDFAFVPKKVTVDYADRVYVVAQDMFQGIMVFDEYGQFTGFSGTISVKLTMAEKIWRKLSTKAQREKQILFLPIEFSNVDIDADGFVYATNHDTDGEQAVRRLNPKGEDVIRKGVNGKISGDLDFQENTTGEDKGGASVIDDVIVREKGIYSVLDSKRGRIFTYDHEGNMLYIFGGTGNQAGTFKLPTAIEASTNADGSDEIYVLDSSLKAILKFSATEYGRLINQAVGYRYDGDETKAVEVWNEVLKLDSNFELANTGIGKAYLTSGENKTAMNFLKIGMSRDYYSVAWKRYRNEYLKENLGYILTGVIGLIIVIILLKKFVLKKNAKKRKRERR